jgi:hypothetical protein
LEAEHEEVQIKLVDSNRFIAASKRLGLFGQGLKKEVNGSYRFKNRESTHHFYSLGEELRVLESSNLAESLIHRFDDNIDQVAYDRVNDSTVVRCENTSHCLYLIDSKFSVKVLDLEAICLRRYHDGLIFFRDFSGYKVAFSGEKSKLICKTIPLAFSSVHPLTKRYFVLTPDQSICSSLYLFDRLTLTLKSKVVFDDPCRVLEDTVSDGSLYVR